MRFAALFKVAFVFISIVISCNYAEAQGLPWIQEENGFMQGTWEPYFSSTVVHLPLDVITAGNTTPDLSDYSNNGDVFGSVAVVADAQRGQVFDFGGADADSASVSNNAGLNNSAFTIAMWIKADQLRRQGIAGKEDHSNSWIIYMSDETGELGFIRGATAGTGHLGPIQAGIWYHIAAVSDGTNIYFYINGVLAGDKKGQDMNNSYPSDIIIGDTVINRFDGKIDDVKIFNDDLDANQILELYSLAVTSSTLASKGVLTSVVYDIGDTHTLGKMSWISQVPYGCSMALSVSVSADTAGLDTFTDLVVVENANQGGNVNLPYAGRWIKWKAMVSMPGIGNPSVTLTQIKITGAVNGVITNPSPILKVGDNLSFDVEFNVPMMTSRNCTVTIATEGGSVYEINAEDGSWNDSYHFHSGSMAISDATAAGFADVRITGGSTAAGQDLYYTGNNLLLIDTKNICSTKLSFFPNPFSPNGDGKAEEAKLMFALSSPVEVGLRIYDFKGRAMRTITYGERMFGNVSLVWDGKDDVGRVCPIGIYIFQLKRGTDVKSGSVVVAK